MQSEPIPVVLPGDTTLPSLDTVESLRAEEARLESERADIEARWNAIRRRRELLEFVIVIARDTRQAILDKANAPVEIDSMMEALRRLLSSVPAPTPEE